MFDRVSICQISQDESWSGFNDLRKNGLLCDVTLISGNVKIPVHRIIMAAHSTYFRSMFTGRMKESGQDSIELSDISADCLSIIIDFIYTHQLSIPLDNVWNVMTAANKLQITGLDEMCASYISKMIDAENCIKLMKAAESYSFHSLYKAARDYLLKEFAEVSSTSPDFLDLLDVDGMISLLSDDWLNVSSEETTWLGVVRWIEHKHDERAPLIVKLLPHIRLAQLDLDSYITIVANYIKTIPVSGDSTVQLQSLFSEYFSVMGKFGPSPVDLSHPLKRPRIPHDVLFVIGGWSGGAPVSYIESYDCRSQRWFSHPHLEDVVPKAYHGMVLLNGIIYVIGGFDGSLYYSSVSKFNPTAEAGKCWSLAAPMYTSRCYLSAAALNNHIYACGGFDGRRRLSSVESYDPVSNQWSVKESMKHRRSDASIASFDGKLYVVGGFNGDECLSSVEVYDDVTNQWTLVESMRSARSGVSVIQHGGALYAIGGFDGSHRLSSCERFCLATRRWEFMESMFLARSNFAVSVLENNIYVIGGFDGTSTIPYVECYNPDLNQWKKVTDMNVNRSALKACVLSSMTDPRPFTYHGHMLDSAGCDQIQLMIMEQGDI